MKTKLALLFAVLPSFALAQAPTWGEPPKASTPPKTWTKPATPVKPWVKPATPVKPWVKPAPKPVAPPFKEPTYVSPKAYAPPPQQPASVDQSQILLANDKQFAIELAELGPQYAYKTVLSDVGVLYDAASASSQGSAAADERFSEFPAILTLYRRPDSAVSYGGTGSSWGIYQVKKGEEVLAEGRYICVWRLENGKWKIISELAAGVDKTGPPVLPNKPNAPKMDTKPPSASLFRADGKLNDALGRETKGN